MPGKYVTVLIPAYNEEDVIRGTVNAAWAIRGVKQVIVVDDGSGDRTAEAAGKSGAQVVVIGRNLGKGGALTAGARHADGEVVLLIDADLGQSASQAEMLSYPVIRGEADMTVAVFPPARKKAGFGLVKGLARAGIRHFTGIEMEAPLSGQRAMRRDLLLKLLPLAGGYGVEVDLTVRAVIMGCRIKEVPVNMSHRATGRDLSSFIHRGRQLSHVALTLWNLKTAGCGGV
ncbi:MAG: glycosyltransferase family 2 protein [Bacillota bacterium]